MPALEWTLSANAKQLNIGSVLENWPSNLNLEFTTQGVRQERELRADLQNLQLSGELRGVNVQADGNLFLEADRLRSDALNLIVGANRVQVNGTLGETLHLDWVVNAPMLQQLDERVSGSIISSGAVRGDRNKPRIQMQAKMENVAFANYALEQLDLTLAPQTSLAVGATINTDTSLKQAPDTSGQDAQKKLTDNPVSPAPEKNALNKMVGELSNENYVLAFTAKQLRLANNRFSTLKVDGAGSINRHELSAVVKNPGYGNADFKLAGNYADGEWQGKLTQLSVKAKKIPRWWLTSSKPIKINANSVSLGTQCFTTRSNLTGVVENADLLAREQLIGEWNPNQSPVNSPYGWLDQRLQLPSSGIIKYSLPQLCAEGNWALSLIHI